MAPPSGSDGQLDAAPSPPSDWPESEASCGEVSLVAESWVVDVPEPPDAPLDPALPADPPVPGGVVLSSPEHAAKPKNVKQIAFVPRLVKYRMSYKRRMIRALIRPVYLKTACVTRPSQL
jgi:hypothetical protein